MDKQRFIIQKEDQTEMKRVFNHNDTTIENQQKENSIKNYAKENQAKIREMQLSNQHKKNTAKVESLKPFKMKKFQNVKSQFYKSYDNSQKTSFINSLNTVNQTLERSLAKQNQSLDFANQNTLKNQQAQEQDLIKQKQNFVEQQEQNQNYNRQQILKDSFQNEIQPIKNDQVQEDEVYLESHALQSFKQLSEPIEGEKQQIQTKNKKLGGQQINNTYQKINTKEQNRKGPLRSRLMSEEEKKEILEMLNQKRMATLEIQNKLPIITTNISILRKKQEYETLIKETENAIKIFSKIYVYIKD